MTQRLNLFLLAMIVILGMPVYWLTIDNPAPAVAARHLDLAHWRRLAASIPGNAPMAVEVETIATRTMPQTFLAAGSGFRPITARVMAFRLPVAGGKPVVIDSGLTRKEAGIAGFRHYDAAAQRRVDAALADAGLVLLTQESPGHMGGVAALAAAGRMPGGLRLSPRQVSPAPDARQASWPAARRPAATLGDSAPQAVAPGIVVIPANGSYAPGSQLIFVRLATGRELLFTGDIASVSASWSQMRLPARILGAVRQPCNRRETLAWLKAIHGLARREKALAQVPGHDIGMLGAGAAKLPARMGFAPSAHPQQRAGH